MSKSTLNPSMTRHFALFTVPGQPNSANETPDWLVFTGRSSPYVTLLGPLPVAIGLRQGYHRGTTLLDEGSSKWAGLIPNETSFIVLCFCAGCCRFVGRAAEFSGAPHHPARRPANH